MCHTCITKIRIINKSLLHKEYNLTFYSKNWLRKNKYNQNHTSARAKLMKTKLFKQIHIFPSQHSYLHFKIFHSNCNTLIINSRFHNFSKSWTEGKLCFRQWIPEFNQQYDKTRIKNIFLPTKFWQTIHFVFKLLS